MTLAELQAQFRSFLLGGSRGVETLTVGTERLPAAARLDVYAQAYRMRLLEALTEDFPGLRAFMGEDAFEVLGTAYIDAHPSDHPSVRWFGRRLAAFLGAAPRYRDQPVLAEMAAFEWTQGEVMDAADSPLLGAAAFESLPPVSWPGMRIVFQSALRRLDLHWNVSAIWQAVDRGETPPEPAFSKTPHPWLFWRRGVEVHWRSLGNDECCAIDAARRGDNFGEICQALLTLTGDDEVPLRAVGFLKRWIADELLAALET